LAHPSSLLNSPYGFPSDTVYSLLLQNQTWFGQIAKW
jgi:hypothetical protein